jgi:tetratricopeptide (TPR) repeat protein
MGKRFWISSWLLLLAMSMPFSIPAAGQTRKDLKKADQLKQAAERAFKQRNYRNAVDSYAQAIVIVPNDAAAHFWKGVAHSYLKEDEAALTELNASLSLGHKPDLAFYQARFGINYSLKKYDDALADAKAGLAIDPNDKYLLPGVGDISYAKADYQTAVDAYQKALLQNPNNPDFYYFIAASQAKLENVPAQADAAKEAIKRGTRYLAESNYLLADSYYKQRRYAEAETGYLATIAAKPDARDAYENLADIYRNENRFNDAIDISKKALRVFGNDANIYTNLAWYYSLADRNEEAIQAAQAGVTLMPGQSLAYTNLCRAYNDTKQYQLAITACNNALKISPKDGETLYYLGRAYDLLNKPNEATRYYDMAVAGLEDFVKERPDYSDGFYLLGNAYYADNQKEKAIQAWKKCLEISPRFVKARYNLGYTYTLKKDKAAALEQYNSLVTMDTGLAAKLKTEIDKL